MTTATKTKSKRIARANEPAPSDEALEAAQSEPQVTAADIIAPNGQYTLRQVARLLGVPYQAVEEAHRSGKFHEHWMTGDELRVSGRRVVDWLIGHEIPHQLDGDAVVAFEKRQAKAAAALAKAAPEKPADVLEEAIDQARAAELARLQAEQEEMDRVWQLYTAILLRESTGAKPDDAEVLADLMRRLELSADDVRRDQQLVLKARRLQADHDAREANHRELQAAAAAYNALRKKYEEEERAAFRRRTEMESRCRASCFAPNGLRLLAKQRPQFFDAGNPPRLRKAQVDGEPDTQAR